VRWPVVIGSVDLVVLCPLVARVGVMLVRVVVGMLGLRKRERERGVMNSLTNGGSEWCGKGEFIIELSILVVERNFGGGGSVLLLLSLFPWRWMWLCGLCANG